jgi:IS605 OrfB family transposase
VTKAWAKANGSRFPKPAYPSKHLGPSISYRFLKDTKGWRVMVTTEYPETAVVSIKHSGAFGIDINAGCLAVAEINRHGNLVGTRVVPVLTYGKTSDQAEAIIGAAVKMIISQAKDTRKPIIIEKLNFKKKRAELEDKSPRHARMLSSFAYNQIILNIKSATSRAGVQVMEVNPAYTSSIGAINYSQKQGISLHQGAAFVNIRPNTSARIR